MTSIDDFTAYLGKTVKFNAPCPPSPLFDGMSYLVSGKITAICIDQDLSQSEFLLDGEFYRFRDVTFVQTLPNPATGG